FRTNDITKETIEAAYKETPEGLTPVLTENVDINTLYLNQDGRVYVDFSKELVEDMNAGSQLEMLIVQSLVDTVGNYYHVQQVYLTVEGEPYESGHIYRGEGEFFTVQTEETKKFQ